MSFPGDELPGTGTLTGKRTEGDGRIAVAMSLPLI